MKPYYEEPGLQLYHGDVRQVLGAVDIKPDCVTADPPYGCVVPLCVAGIVLFCAVLVAVAFWMTRKEEWRGLQE